METKKTLTQAEEVIIDYILSTILENVHEEEEEADVNFSDTLLCLTDFDIEVVKGLLKKVKQ